MDTAKVWLVIAAVLILVGGLLFVGVMSGLGWDFSRLSTVQYETNEYEITDAFHSVSIHTNTADVTVVPSEDKISRVVCHERVNEKHSVAVEDGTLVIRLTDTRKWYEHIGIFIDTPKITVYLPPSSHIEPVVIPENQPGYVLLGKADNLSKAQAAVEQALQITTATGAIHMENIIAGNIALRVSTGMVTLADIICQEDVTVQVSTGQLRITGLQCKNLLSDGSTGNVHLENVIAEDSISVERSTGNVKFDGCDAEKIFVETDTGNVTGTLLTEKVFRAETDTGYIDVPKTTAGGICELETDTGNIKISLK